MRKLYSLVLSALALAGFVSCQQEPVIEELDLARCLTPTNVTAIIRNGEYINFNWDKSKTAEAFEVELYTNEALEGEPAFTLTIPKEDLPYLAHVEADETYFFRVRATSSQKEPSKWYVHPTALETSAIKSPLDPEIVDRSAGSITIKWTQDDEVDHIRVTPPLGEDQNYTRFDVDEAAVAAASAEVTGLNPSTQYSLTVHFKSAERGTVSAWTLPDLTGAVKVETAEALKQAIADGAAKIEVAYSDTPYEIGAVVPVSSGAIYGDENAEGARPVIFGHIALDPSVEAVTSLHFENLLFTGNMSADHTHVIVTSAAGTMSDISFLNCDVTDYLRGLLYDNYGLSVTSISYDNVTVSNIAGDGGDGFDIRQACAIGSVKFSDCTFNDGFRTFVRIDANPKLETFEFTNNTVNNLCHIVNGNNNGVLHIRAKKADGTNPNIILKNNLFLNCNYGDASVTNRGCLIGSNAADMLPTEVAKNFFYNCSEAFFNHPVSSVEQLGVDKCIAGGGEILKDDPCVNSEGGNFYVMNETVLAAPAGATRWLSGYVEVPEDLTLAVTEPVKTWDLTDTKTFGKEAKKDMVRDGIRFYVKDNFVNIGSQGFTFGAAAKVAAGIPSDGGLGILVNRPGGLVVSTLSAGDDGAFLAVSLDGKVKAGIPVGTNNSKVILDAIEAGKETMIYIYPTAPIILSGLQWTDDIEEGGPKVLDTPVLAIDKESVAQGEAETVTVSWEAVAKAGSYDVTFNGATKNMTETSYAISTAALAAGDYTVSVVAKPAADDLVREASAAAEIGFSVKEVLKKVSATSPTVWGPEYMSNGVTKFGSGTEITADMVYGNLGFVAGGGKFKFGIDDADTAPKNRLQLASTGTVGTKGNLQFIAGGPGTLILKARSSGDDARPLVVAVGSTEVDRKDAPAKTAEPTEFTFTVNAAAGDLVNIYSGNKGINLYSITWTPEEGSGPAPVRMDWNFSSTEWQAAFATWTGATSGADCTNPFEATVDGLTVKIVKSGEKNRYGSTYIQFGGAGNKETDNFDGNRTLQFTAPEAGKLSVVTSTTGNTADTTRSVSVSVDGGTKQTKDGAGVAANAEHAVLEFEIEAGKVVIFPEAGLRFYEVHFTNQ